MRKTIYNIWKFFIEQCHQMMEFVSAVIDAVRAIAEGKVNGIASSVERALGRSLPVLIGTVAVTLGIESVAARIRNIISRMQAKVNDAIDYFLQEVRRLYGLVSQGNGNRGQQRSHTPRRTSGTTGRSQPPRRTAGTPGRSQPPRRTSGTGRSPQPRQNSGATGRSQQPTQTNRTSAATRGNNARRPTESRNQVDQRSRTRALADFRVEHAFTMSGEPHRLIGIFHRGKFDLFIASDPEKFEPALRQAITEIHNSTGRSVEEREFILKKLNETLKEVRELDYEVEMNRGDILRGAPRNNQAEQEVIKRYTRRRLAQMANDLEQFARIFGVRSLHDFYRTPRTLRYIPKIDGYESVGEFIRKKLYEGLNSSNGFSPSWSARRQQVENQEKQPLINRVRAVQQSRNQTLWNQLIRDGLVEKNANISSYEPTRVNYDVDHEEPLAVRWNQKGGNDDNDAKRHAQMIELNNLRLVTAQFNRSRGSGGVTYDPYVKQNFTSIFAEGGIKGALKINGKPFEDATGNSLV